MYGYFDSQEVTPDWSIERDMIGGFLSKYGLLSCWFIVSNPKSSNLKTD